MSYTVQAKFRNRGQCIGSMILGAQTILTKRLGSKLGSCRLNSEYALPSGFRVRSQHPSLNPKPEAGWIN